MNSLDRAFSRRHSAVRELVPVCLRGRAAFRLSLNGLRLGLLALLMLPACANWFEPHAGRVEPQLIGRGKFSGGMHEQPSFEFQIEVDQAPPSGETRTIHAEYSIHSITEPPPPYSTKTGDGQLLELGFLPWAPPGDLYLVCWVTTTTTVTGSGKPLVRHYFLAFPLLSSVPDEVVELMQRFIDLTP